MKKSLLIIFLIIMLISTNGMAFAAKTSKLKIKRLGLMADKDYLGGNVVVNINDFQNLILGGGISQGLEFFIGRHFDKGKFFTIEDEELIVKEASQITYDVAAGLNTEEGVIIFGSTNYKLNNDLSCGITAHSASGLILNINYMY